MVKFWAIILAFLIYIVIFTTSARSEEFVIRNNGGGNVGKFIALREEYQKKYDLVKIEGKCLSSCSIFTTMKNACVNKNAKIGFHGTSPVSGFDFIDKRLDYRLGQFYRGKVKEAYMGKWRFLRGSNNFKILTAKQYKRMDPKIKICK